MEAGGSARKAAGHETNELQLRTSGSLNSAGSSVGRFSFGLPGGFHSHVDEEAESENVSRTGDAGGRELNGSRRHSGVSAADNNGVVLGQLRRNGSLGRASSTGASFRRLFSTSSANWPELEEDVESKALSQAGDDGEPTVHRRGSQRESARFFVNQGTVFPNPEEQLESYGVWPRDPSKLTPVSPVLEIATPVSADAVLIRKQEEKKEVSPSLEYFSCLLHLAVFGILGVFTRYLLQKLFGPNGVGLTSDDSILYSDLPSNVAGSFLMGWFGVEFKGDISRLSDQLAIGITTGYLGSLTTFSGWDQKMLELSVKGKWAFAVIGYFAGLLLADAAIRLGVGTANGFRRLLGSLGKGSGFCKWRVDNYKRHIMVISVLVLILVGLWVTSITLEKKDFENGGSAAQLWLACLVAPLGVWIRWRLARLNGRGLGKSGLCKWLPVGTLAANVSASCMMSALATVKKAVNTKNCDTVATGIQLGFLGCLSTVSTFIAEYNAMNESSRPWRAYAYAIMTLGTSFALGTLIYSVPVWTKHYH